MAALGTSARCGCSARVLCQWVTALRQRMSLAWWRHTAAKQRRLSAAMSASADAMLLSHARVARLLAEAWLQRWQRRKRCAQAAVLVRSRRQAAEGRGAFRGWLLASVRGAHRALQDKSGRRPAAASQENASAAAERHRADAADAEAGRMAS
ncbi:unnamed protein product, partial [Polarella glacialis]